jgi:hypothetical protein
VSPGLSAIGVALDRSASGLAQGRPLTIVAMGSSSTQGIGASAPDMSYPSRLEGEILVLHRVTGGQDVGEEPNRLDVTSSRSVPNW